MFSFWLSCHQSKDIASTEPSFANKDKETAANQALGSKSFDLLNADQTKSEQLYIVSSTALIVW